MILLGFLCGFAYAYVLLAVVCETSQPWRVKR